MLILAVVLVVAVIVVLPCGGKKRKPVADYKLIRSECVRLLVSPVKSQRKKAFNGWMEIIEINL